ncbi:MAG: hypothetical protein KGJ23_12905 [Euryarchaeota archaeon]|nr:hypothetical protein [Euryarchaeota archaeon]MDE1837499.1 hypothetical protein [Euryarchaeota archaeon]MDE1880545.1 hypothetical protein [Euryarchaeota archaeon]MDE2045535.1 hypothetical protein [Thermoplasmata archaeon]
MLSKPGEPPLCPGSTPLLSRRWAGRLPTLVVVVLLGEMVFWGGLALLRAAPPGVILYLLPWTLCMGLSLHLADGRPRARGAARYLGAVLALSLLEEALAFAVGGGLGGHATSLADDWLRSVPGFFVMGVAVLAAQRRWGSDALDGFWSGAVAGVLIEIVVGRGAQPLAFLTFGGVAAWTYGALAGFPLLPGGHPVPRSGVRRIMTVATAVGALLLAELVAYSVAGALHV